VREELIERDRTTTKRKNKRGESAVRCLQTWLSEFTAGRLTFQSKPACVLFGESPKRRESVLSTRPTSAVKQLRWPWLLSGRQEEVSLTHAPSPPIGPFVTFLGRMWRPRTRKIFLTCDVFCHILTEKRHILAPLVQNFFEREEMWRFCLYLTSFSLLKRECHLGSDRPQVWPLVL